MGEVFLLIHTIVQDETLWQISQRYGITLEDLLENNSHITNPNMIPVGLAIRIPANAVPEQKTEMPSDLNQKTAPELTLENLPPRPLIYIVRSGDTMQNLANTFRLQLDELISANPHIIQPDYLKPGDKLFIPRNRPGYARPPRRPLTCPYKNNTADCPWLSQK